MPAASRTCLSVASALVLLVLSAAAIAQQPTLRYSATAARKMSQQDGDEQKLENPGAVGTGIHDGVRPASHSGPSRGRIRIAQGYREELMEESISAPAAGERIVIDEGDDNMDRSMPVHGYAPGASCDTCGNAWGGRVYGGDPACGECCALPCFRIDNIELFAGAQGFTGPLNRGSGSFGFHEGINAGMPFICGLAIQGGYQATQSNFEGSFFTPDDRTQSFVTVGAFRRVDLGLQGGVVVDYLNDTWDYSVNLTQIRGELSWRMPCDHEFGFWFAAGLDQSTVSARDAQFAIPGGDEDTVAITNGTFNVQPLNIYAFFYRKQFACGGEARAWGGFTDDSRGLLGGNIRLPVSTCLAFSTDFLYVMPRESSPTSFTEEAWNVSFNLVWTPCFRNRCGPNYCRPLFDVANNGSFVVRADPVRQ
jgi:uncharacterized protein DUF6666